MALERSGALPGQARSKVERLGYPPDARLLIVHADDLGLAHSQNAAAIAALESGAVSSGSLMVTTPWAPEFLAWYDRHPDADIGVHLTLTSEWHTLRWRGLLAPAEAPSLYDATGYLPKTVAEVATRANAAEAERELRAQVERALELGLHPTHLDTHMGAVLASSALFESYLRVAREYRLPVAIPHEMFEPGPESGIAPGLGPLAAPEEVLADRYVMAPDRLPPAEWPSFYTNAVRALQPGTITQIVVHLAYDDAEMRAATAGYDIFEASWRQRDFDYFTSDAWRSLLSGTGVKLTTWRELGRLLTRAS